MGLFHASGIVAQEVLSPFGVGLSRMGIRLACNDNPLAIYQLAATILPDAFTKNWERAA
jgi:hypothetical protein